ncbi:hypothetical protein BU15DRAFT_23980, partial [Melanogaster broomeanus]
VPDVPAERLYTNWKSLIPSLLVPYLHYTLKTSGKPLTATSTSISLCTLPQVACTWKSTKILCLFFDHDCKCSTLMQVLVHFGLFPTAPS